MYLNRNVFWESVMTGIVHSPTLDAVYLGIQQKPGKKIQDSPTLDGWITEIGYLLGRRLLKVVRDPDDGTRWYAIA